MDNLSKHLLLFLAVLFMLILVPTAFASDIDDAGAVGVENQLAADDVSLSTNDVAVESISQSAIDDNEDVSDESDVLENNNCESDVITAANDAIYVDGFDGSGGSGTIDNPYHSLKNVLTTSDNLGNEIYLLPGTYDFGNTAVDLYERNFTLNAMGDVIFTSSNTLFHKFGTEFLTLNGIQFRDITSSSSAILYTGSSVEGTLNLINCSFINNKGTNLIQTSYNITIKGCTFIDNEATGTSLSDGGLIKNVLGSPTIDISYSIFIGNKIHLIYMDFHPLIVNGIGSSELTVYFNNNFVNYNNSVNGETIMPEGCPVSFGLIYITGTAPSVVSAGDTVDLVVNFSKYNLRPLNDYMHDLDVSLVPRVNVCSLPVSIINNGGKCQYTAKSGVSYTEIVDVKYGDHILTTFEFYVANGDLLNPKLTVPTSIIADIGTGVNINATHVGDGIVSYVVADESVATVDANGVVTAISEGVTTITVNIAATDTYGEDSKQVKFMVKDPADDDVVYVDGLDGYGGSGIKVDPYHSLFDVIYDSSFKEIRFLPGTYDFENIVDLNQVTNLFIAAGDDVIFTTSSRYMFEVRAACNVTFKGIKFKDSNVDNAVVTRTFSKAVGTLNFINCDFINNTGTCLIDSSCNVNIKGCKFIDNKATGTFITNCGLIHDYGASTNTINVSYSIFINNEISYSNNGYNPIVVDWNNGNGPAVIFNYNFVNNNNDLNNNAIAYHASSITKAGYTVITPTAPTNVYTRHSADLVVKFTKNGGGALDDYMPNLTIELAPREKTGSIPVTITNNTGKGKYIAKNQANTYRETVDVNVNGNAITNFQFNVIGSNNYGTTISADDLVMSYKDGSSWAVTLTDVYGNVISGATVKIGIDVNGLNKVYSFVTDANGVASLPINLVSGTYDVNATFAGDNRYESSFVSAIVTVNKAVAVLTGENIEMSYNDGTSWDVTLTDGNGNAISGVKVAFGVLGKVYNISTDGTGVAKLPINLPSGNYTATASFSNSKYQAESISATITVNKVIPVLSAEDLVMYYKDGSAWDVTLTDANGNIMADTYVKFTVAGKTYSRKTNAEGVASLPINLPVGTYNISAKCEGTNFVTAEINKTIVVNLALYDIDAEDVNMVYQDGSSYNVQLIDVYSNPIALAGEIIKITILGKSYYRTTNSDGIASLPINLRPGTYEITAEYKGIEIGSIIVVNKA